MGTILCTHSTYNEGFEISVDGGAFFAVGSNRSWRLTLANGEHVVRIRGFDVAGNPADSQTSFHVDMSFLAFAGPTATLVFVLVFGTNAAIVLAIVARRRRRRS